MGRPILEVADIFRDHGPAWRKANAGHVSLGQLKVMAAIESCRTAALGGHVARCEDCAHEVIAYNSCRNRHCPKCQGAAARGWVQPRFAQFVEQLRRLQALRGSRAASSFSSTARPCSAILRSRRAINYAPDIVTAHTKVGSSHFYAM